MNNQELQKEIEALKLEIQNMKSNSTLNYDMGVAMKDRLGLTDTIISFSSVDSSPSVQFVDEAGSSSYNVAAPMAGFVYILTSSGVTYKLARY